MLGDDEAEAAGIGREPPDDEIHLLGQAEAVAANLQQLAGATSAFSCRLKPARSSRGTRSSCVSSRAVAG